MYYRANKANYGDAHQKSIKKCDIIGRIGGGE